MGCQEGCISSPVSLRWGELCPFMAAGLRRVSLIVEVRCDCGVAADPRVGRGVVESREMF